MYIPKSHIITLEMAKASPIGAKMVAAGLNLLSPKHCFLTTYILQERRKESTFWKPYLDILPECYDNFPIFYTEDERQWLKGSPFLKQVYEKIADIDEDYATICRAVPEYSQFPVAEFSQVRMAVSSRIFGMQIDGVKTDGFVPYADMLNHRRPRQTSWTYEQSRNGFIIESLEEIKRGEEVLDSYGKKCNSRFLLNYGFIVLNNDANEFPFKLQLRADDEHYVTKRNLLENQFVTTYRVQATTEEQVFSDYLAHLRFIELDDISIVPQLIQTCQDEDKRSFKVTLIPPISIENERKVLQHAQAMAQKALGKYPTTLEEDTELLKSSSLTQNQRNCVLMRQGEKEILHWYLNLATKVLSLLDMPKKDVKKASKNSPYEQYIQNSIIPLLKK